MEKVMAKLRLKNTPQWLKSSPTAHKGNRKSITKFGMQYYHISAVCIMNTTL